MEFQEKAIAVVIRRLRKKKRVSQEVLSELAGMGRSHWGMVETSGRVPSLYTLWRIADALDMRPSELVALIEEEMETAGQRGKG